jgi:CDP-glycerol glycerophosphotransferase (TagB/SpsB family)
MDFAYMDKPVIYYQFDYERFRENHLSEGYYSYKDDGFGPIHDDEDELVKNVIDMGLNNFELKEEYRKRIKSFFTLRDNHNCERTFSELIKGLKNEK